MAVTTKKAFPATTNTSTTTFGPIGIELNNQDDLDVYITESGGSRVLQYKQSTASTTDSNHPQVNDTTGLYFPPVSAGVTLKNYLLSADNNNVIFNSALPNGAIVSVERRTRDGSGDYTAFSAGSTMRSTDLNSAFDEVRFTAQEGRNKAFDLENQLDHRDITIGPGKGIEFEGSTIDGNETKLVVTDPTADRTVTIPDQSGNVIVSGNASIVNADVSPTAEIAVSKLGDGSARQLLQTDSAGTGVEWTSNVRVPGTFQSVSTGQFDSNLTIAGTTTAATVDINGGAIDGTTIGSSSASTGAFTTLNASGTTTAAAINASGAVGVDGNFDVNTNKFTVASSTGNTTVAGTLGVTGTTTAAAINASGAVGVDGDFDVNTNKFTVAAATGNTVIAGNLDVTGQFDVTGTSNYTGQQTVPGGALVKDIRVGLDGNNEVSTASGSLVLDSASGTVQVTDHFNVTGNADIDTNLNVDGTLTVDGVSTLTGAVTATGGVVGNLTGNVTGNTSGNAGTATALQNARTIGGVSFNGTANINLPGVNTAGNQNTSGNAATATDLAAAAKITNAEQGSHTANDTTYYTTSASDARYYNIGSLEEIQSGETWAADDAKIATTAAIDARIVDLVDDVGGFVPIANETSFPNANPDVNNGSGTLVSVKALASNLTSNGSGVATISNGTVGNSTVTINGLANSTTYPAGRGMLVETTSTLNTYTFHRQLAEATSTTTVANNIGNVNTCATNISNINAVAADATDIGVVAGKETEIGRLGTADAVADMNTLATTAIVADLETCADNNANISTTAGAISNVNTVAGSIGNVNTTAGAIGNVNTTAGAIANVNNVGNNIANVNTVGSNIGTVNDFAARYRAPQTNANEYDTSLDVGDLYFNTTINALKVYTGSAWVAGVTQTGDYALKTGSTYTGNNIHNDSIKSIYGTSGDGLEIHHTSNNSYIKDNGTGALYIDGSSIRLRNYANSNTMAEFIGDGEVKLYHNNGWRVKTTATGIQMNGDINLGDGNRVKIGGGDDLQIYHSSDTSNIINSTGHFTISNAATSSHLYLQAKNGEQSIVAERDGGVLLYYDNSKKAFTHSGGFQVDGHLSMTLADNYEIRLGQSNDLKLYHSGSNNIIESGGTTEIHINKGTTENMAKFIPDGAVELYHNGVKKLETLSNGVRFLDSDSNVVLQLDTNGGTQGYIYADSNQIQLQTGGGETSVKCIKDGATEIYHNGTIQATTYAGGFQMHGEGYIKGAENSDSNLYMYADEGDDNADKWKLNAAAAGGWYLENNAGGSWERSLRAIGGGTTELYYDHVKKLETTSSGVTVAGWLQGTQVHATDYIKVSDGDKIYCGGDNDLHISHSGSHAELDNYTGNLSIRQLGSSGDIYLDPKSGERGIKVIRDGGIELYYDNSVKLNTNSGGVKVLGHLYQDDNSQLRLGDNSECQIYHSSDNNTYIHESGSGSLVIKADDFYVQNAAASLTQIKSDSDAGVEISHAGTKKIETTSTGVTVSGTVLAATSDTAGYKQANSTYGSQIWIGGWDSGTNSAGICRVRSSNDNLHIDSGSNGELFLQSYSGGNIRLGSPIAEHTNDAMIQLRNTSYNSYLYIGGWSTANSANISRIRTSNDNLHIDSGANGAIYLNNYSAGSIYSRALLPMNANTYDIGAGNNYWNSFYGTNFYANDWFRNNNSGEGIYNQATGQHFYSDDDDYWNIAGGSSANGLRFRDENNGTIRGYVYANNSNECGILTGVGEWGTKSVLNSATYLMYDGAETISTQSHGTRIAANKDLRFQNGNWTGNAAAKLQHHENKLYICGGSSGTIFRNHAGSDRWRMEENGTFRPNSDNSYDLGTSSYRIRNVYTYDLHLNNSGSQNDVDGTWGSWTIQEGEDDLFLLNRRNGKKYKFNLTEVS